VTDFVDDFMSYTTLSMSPKIFRLWAGIFLLAGALERRVWVNATDRPTFPNLYVMLVAAPGVGKQVIEDVRGLLQGARLGAKEQVFKVSPVNMTNASLMDALGDAKQVFLPPNGGTFTYHSLCIAAEEASVLLPVYEPGYIGALNYIYQNPQEYHETRRTSKVKELRIDNPQFNILIGAQPAYLAATFPEVAWDSGFARRLIFVYASEGPSITLFQKHPDNKLLRLRIIDKLLKIAKLWGEAKWTEEAMIYIRQEALVHYPPTPTHSRLTHYNRVRTQNLLKLSLISAISRCQALLIEKIDVERGLYWMHEAERFMPDIFREMVGKSDKQVLEELHLFLIAYWQRNKRNPFQGDVLWDFLKDRVPSDRVGRMVEVAERSGLVARVGGTEDCWVPRPRGDRFGVE
jgi:hypothetical protein